MTSKRSRTKFFSLGAVYVLSNLLAMAVGALMVQQGETQKWDWMTGAGISVIAAGVTGFVLIGYMLVTETVRNRITVLQDFGIRDYFDSNTTPIRGEYAARLNTRSREIDVLGLGLNSLRRDFSDSLSSWASAGRVRILLIDPDYPTQQTSFADQRDSEERDAHGKIRGEVHEWIKDTEELRRRAPENFQIHLYRCLPTITLVRIDNEAFWSPYLARRGSSATPTMLVHRGGLLYDVVKKHFDDIWNDKNLSVPVDATASTGGETRSDSQKSAATESGITAREIPAPASDDLNQALNAQAANE